LKPDVLMIGPMMERVMAALDEAYRVHRLWQVPDPAAFLAEVGPDIRGIATRGDLTTDGALIDALPKLEIIACYGVGTDGIDLERARARGVLVTNTPDVLTDEVADLALALLLATVRGICKGDRYVRSGRWLEGNMELMRSPKGKRLGILGLGRIGQAAAKRFEVLGMEICYHGPREKPDQPYPYYGDLAAMARDCDFLVLTCPGGPATENLVNRQVLDALGPDGILINVARGSVVDEPELVDALVSGRLGGAGLDVFAQEPKVPEALFELESVVLQPHQASATVETRGAMGDLVVDNLAAHFAGRPVLTAVP
jgi:lactate dehydrogenase-like 2-hydroxyacid dehydrogenase